jgi:hypothetical protein
MLVYMLFYILYLTFVPPWPWNLNINAIPTPITILSPIPSLISFDGMSVSSSPTVRSFLFPSSSYVCEGLDGNSTNGNFTNAVGETASLDHFRFRSGSSTVSAFVNARPPTPTGLPPRHARFSTGYHGPALPLSFRWQKISPSNRTSRFFPFRQLSRPLSPTVWPTVWPLSLTVLSRFLPTFSNFAQSVVLQDICFCRERMGYNISRTSIEDGFFFQGGTSVLCSNAFSDGRSTTQPPRMFSLVCALRFGNGSFLLRLRRFRRDSVKYDLWGLVDDFRCFAKWALGDRCSAGILSIWDCICFTYLGAKLVSSIHTSMWDWCAYGVIAALSMLWMHSNDDVRVDARARSEKECSVGPNNPDNLKPDTKTGVIF